MAFGKGQPAQPVTVNTADAVGKAASGRLCGVDILPTGAVTPTVTIFDNPAAASGNVLFGPCKIVSATPTLIQFGDEGVNAATGIYVHADSWTTLSVTVRVK
jgi:hypothetical protein